MATPTAVKEYIAKWLQMGKALCLEDTEITLREIIKGESYTTEFEQIWQSMTLATLKGTNQTIQELLKPEWEIINCAICELPVACLGSGYRQIYTCPCSDLPLHPNLDTIPPHIPIHTATHLQSISDRLK